ncbi:MAG: efflux RND transporter periplasmic adaptor subunit [Myxococcales bacterium]|nr:efflux RND transporter periplasmic adaptor subunit [Myxococcales bacterium]
MMFPRILSVVVVISALGAAGCRGGSPRPTGADLPLTTVGTSQVRRAESSVTQQIVGTVRARTTASIAPNVMGRVSELKVTLGSNVRAGDVLVRLSAGEIDAKARQSAALLDQAKLELTRAKSLEAKHVIARAELDAIASRHRVALASLGEARVMQSYTVLRAPFSGVVTAKLANVGDQAMPGRPLLILEDPTALRLEGAVPEGLAAGLATGQKLTVRVEAASAVLTGRIAEISPSADANTRTVLVKLDLDPAKELRPGQFGRVELTTGQRRSLEVPKSAVVPRGQLELVFVADKGRAQLRLVRTGAEHGDQIDILSGLDAGESVIVSNASLLSDGQPIEVK